MDVVANERGRSASGAAAPRPSGPVARRHAVRWGPGPTLVYNALYWPYLLASSIVLFLPALLLFFATFLWDRRLALLHRYTSLWGAHYLLGAPFVTCRRLGISRAPDAAPCIYVANHQSMVDILAAFSTGLEFKWISKRVNFFVPFIGWNMALNRYVALRRGDKRSIARMYAACERHLARGSSLFFFPEGTRSPTLEIREFKLGAFRLAVQAGAKVVPVVIDGTGQILGKGSLAIRPAPVVVSVLDPVEPGASGGDPERLAAEVRRRMIAELERLRGRTRELSVAA